MAEGSFMLVGLGNPGRQYEATRHNLGFMLIDRISRLGGIALDKRTGAALWGAGVYEGTPITLVKPLTYMNRSGEAVRALVKQRPPGLDRLWVAHDELDLPLGRMRLRTAGGAGGHRGVRSVIASLGTNEFGRIRLGIGRPPEGWDAADYVLSPFSRDEHDIVDDLLERGVDAVMAVIQQGAEVAMDRFNPAP